MATMEHSVQRRRPSRLRHQIMTVILHRLGRPPTRTEAELVRRLFDHDDTATASPGAGQRGARSQHVELRRRAKALGIRTSFAGSTRAVLETLTERAESGEPVPIHLVSKAHVVMRRIAEYDTLLAHLTLKRLARAFPAKHWRAYEQHGWARLRMRFCEKERHVLALVYRVALAELGVDPCRPATYVNVQHVAGYDPTWGWLRNPGCLSSQLYAASHPRMYRLLVGLYARLLLRGGQQRCAEEEARAVRGCVELRLQMYNTKIALPSTQTRTFCHLDADWRRGGCSTPAPQCMLSTSPSHVQNWSSDRGIPTGECEVYRCRFARLSAEEERGQGALASADDTESPSLKRRRLCHRPYSLPRKRGEGTGRATKPPVRLQGHHFASAASEMQPTAVQLGDALFFDHLVAHEFAQFRTLPTDMVPTDVPVELTRTAEYPQLVSPILHGKPHQTKAEVLTCMLTGRPPPRWSHVYTGNPIPANARNFDPVVPPLAAQLHTPLSRCLAGVERFRTCPHATGWLLRALATDEPKAALKVAETEAVAEHRRQLDELESALCKRLRRLADSTALVGGHPDHCQRSLMATEAATVIPAAARAALEDNELFPVAR